MMVLLCLLASCAGPSASEAVAGPGDDPGRRSVESTPTSVPGSDPGSVGDPAEVPGPEVTGARTGDDTGGASWRVAVDVTATGFGGDDIEGSLIWEGDPRDGAVDGVFGRYGGCAGWRESVGAYSVVVSGGTGSTRSVSVWTPERVTGAGTYDAEVRLEAGAALVGAGTIEIDADLRHGSFSATGIDGGTIEGRFECAGPPSPTPLAEGADDGRLDTVEVFALLRLGDAERVAGFVTLAGPGVECPGSGDGVLLEVVGDERLGSITSFSVSGEPSPHVRFEAGGLAHDLADPELMLDAGGASGVFSGTTVDGISVDGAFRCT